MGVMEKSDLLIVAMKRANKAASAAAELVERRGGAKENAELQSTVRTQSRAAVSQAQARIREAVFTREAVPRHHPRWEPGALAAPAGICAGGGEKSPSLPRPPPLARECHKGGPCYPLSNKKLLRCIGRECR
jgi:hypothetical protein